MVVLGRNGVGKTTLIHSIVSFVKPRRGAVWLGGKEITAEPTHEIMRQGVALVPQGRRVFRSLSVAENLAIPFRCSLQSETEIRPWTEQQVAGTFSILWKRRDQKAGSLSGGEQQMLAVARALVSGPKVLLLDEPSEGLGPMVVKEIARIISGLAKQGMAVLLVEQNFGVALSLADKVYVMSRGKIVYESVPQELVHNEDIKSRFLGM
jgi:branched-chain amino acid transport system ATP-binding protein